jgi:hypothetical protein
MSRRYCFDQRRWRSPVFQHGPLVSTLFEVGGQPRTQGVHEIAPCEATVWSEVTRTKISAVCGAFDVSVIICLAALVGRDTRHVASAPNIS